MLEINKFGDNKDFGEEYEEEIPLDGQSLDSGSKYDPDENEDNISNDEDSYGNENVENCSQTPTPDIKKKDSRKRQLEGAYVGYKRTKERKVYHDVARNERTLKIDILFCWCSGKEEGTNKEKGLVENRNYDNITSENERQEIKHVKEWFHMLPKVPSHYLFLEWCRENGKPAATRQVFAKLLNKEKIAMHTPRKDECNTCCGYKVGTVSSEEYQKHLKRKDEARAAKETASSKKIPMDYVARMRVARPKQTYKIKVLDYDFFYKYDDLPTNLPSLRPGKKAGDPTVTDIRKLRYLPSGEIQYKLELTEEWKTLPQRRNNIKQKVLVKRLYQRDLEISESKYKHLQELKNVIEK
ncbi:hypothetical protein ILUMI_08336 [Ignelater luminosus]|uniref:Uncharacterized protein n=1 Tax=Ignelater luminosus TaxID=2038154 RepID=A0A8K0DBH8_IGNLU|nr:hypothetical protein ILUMI_08336 [Ignelater luminosus]